MNTFLWNQIELSNLRDCKGCKAVFLLLTDLTLPLQPFLRKEAHPLFWLLPLKSLNLSMGHPPFLALTVRRQECAEIKNMDFTGKKTFQTFARPAGTLGPVMSSLRLIFPIWKEQVFQRIITRFARHASIKGTPCLAGRKISNQLPKHHPFTRRNGKEKSKQNPKLAKGRKNTD